MTDLIETFHFGDTKKKKKKKKKLRKKSEQSKTIGTQKTNRSNTMELPIVPIDRKVSAQKNKLKEITCNET